MSSALAIDHIADRVDWLCMCGSAVTYRFGYPVMGATLSRSRALLLAGSGINNSSIDSERLRRVRLGLLNPD